MIHKQHPTDDAWENDAVWKLLDQVPPAVADPHFVNDTLRAARCIDQSHAWWHRLFAPAPITGFAAATAALALLVVFSLSPTPDSTSLALALDSPQAAQIQDIAESETLIAAADHLDDFSDTELVSMIGF